MISTPFSKSLSDIIGKILLLTALYFLTGKLGLMLAVPPGFATVIWPPSGIAIGFLIIFGLRLWPGIFLGSFVLNATLSADNYLTTEQILIAAGIAAGSTLQAISGRVLVSKFLGIPLAFKSIKQTFLLFFLTGPVSCLIAATIGVACLHFLGNLPIETVSRNWLTWWTGDVFGVLVFLPLVLIAPGQPHTLTWKGQAIGTLPVLAMLVLIMPLGLTFYVWKISAEYVYEKNKAHFELLVNAQERSLLYASFMDSNFINSLPRIQNNLVNLKVYQGDPESNDSIILNTANKQQKEDFVPAYSIKERLNVPQKTLTLVWTSTPAFEKSIRSKEPVIIMIGGLMLTSMFGIFLILLSHRANIIQRLVDQKTREISSNEKRMKLLIKNTPAAVAMFDEKMRYIMTSDRWISDYDLKNKNIIGLSHYEVFPEILNMPRWLDIHSRVLSGETFCKDEDFWIRADGKKEWVKYDLHPWINIHGEIGGLVMFTDVITQRKEMEDALRASEETFRSAMEYASIGKALVYPDGRWMKVNKALCQILGYSEDELLKLDFQTITHPDDLEEDLKNSERLLSGEIQSYSMEKRYIHKDGHIVWILLSGSLVRNSDESPKYFIAQVHDINELKEVQKVKDDFISIVSHELRTPATSINLSLNLIEQNITEDFSKQTKKFITMAIKNSERLMVIINDILDLNKIAEGKMIYDIQPENLAILVQQTIEENYIYGDKYGIKFVFEAAPKEFVVNVDAYRVSQVLVNFLSNAAKFSNKGKAVRIFLTNDNDRVRVNVQDYGVGIFPEFRYRLFQKFSRVESSSTWKSEGTGLGLHISKEMIEQMGGAIGFESEDGIGSIFWFEFPVVNQ